MPRKAPTTPERPVAEPQSGNPLVRFLFRPNLLLLLAGIVSAAVWMPNLVRLLPNLDERPEYRMPTRQIDVGELPHWVPRDLVDQAIRRGGLPDEISLLDADVTREIADAFRLHPWVADVVQVRKAVPASIKVELVYRQPVGMVEVKQGVYPVDATGVLLPPTDFSVADTRTYPKIENVTSTPQGPAGTGWGDVSVEAAARLAALLVGKWSDFGLSAIRVPDRTQAKVEIDELILELRTAGGSVIIWGRVPKSGHPGELSAEQKIGRLEKYLSDFGSFDLPHGPYEIDIRHWQEISRRPLAAAVSHPRR